MIHGAHQQISLPAFENVTQLLVENTWTEKKQY